MKTSLKSAKCFSWPSSGCTRSNETFRMAGIRTVAVLPGCSTTSNSICNSLSIALRRLLVMRSRVDASKNMPNISLMYAEPNCTCNVRMTLRQKFKTAAATSGLAVAKLLNSDIDLTIDGCVRSNERFKLNCNKYSFFAHLPYRRQATSV